MNKKQALEFYDKQPIVILTTVNNDGAPQTRALVNLRNENISPNLVEYFKKHDRILLMTNTHSDKISEIKTNSNASLYTYDNNYSGMMLGGTLIEITDDETKDAVWDESLLHYYPDGRHGGDFSVIEFIPKTFKTYRGTDFEKTKGKIE